MNLVSLRIVPTLSFPITPIIPIGLNLPKFPTLPNLSVFSFHLSSSKHKQPSWLDTNSAVCYFSPFCIIPPSIYLFGYQGRQPRG